MSPLLPDEDYYDPVTRAIDTEKLGLVKCCHASGPPAVGRRKVDKDKEQTDRNRSLTKEQSQAKELAKFRDDDHKLRLFERDEASYAS